MMGPIRYKAKDFLRRYRAAKLRMESARREIEKQRESLTGITAQIKQDKITGGGGADRMADAVAHIIDAEAALCDEAEAVETALREVLAAINSVPDEMQRAVLMLRYIEGLDWLEIAGRIGYEISNTYIIHGKALAAVDDWLKLCRKL